MIFFLASLTPKAACCSVSVVVYCWFKVRHDITGSENPSRRRLPDFRSGLSSPCPSRSRLSPALPKCSDIPGERRYPIFRSVYFFKSRFASPPSLRFDDLAYLRAAFGGGGSRRPPPPRSPRRPQGNEFEFSNLNDDAPDMSRAEEGLTICYFDGHPSTQTKWCVHRVFGCIFSPSLFPSSS